jgi:hypothetical protein
MTTTTATNPVARRGRILAVTRLQFVDVRSVLVLPWIILGAILVLNIAIWWVVLSEAGTPAAEADVRDGLQWSGASSFIFIYMLIVAMQAIAGTFPFALGFGVTRRNYYLGTSLAFVILSVVYAAGLTLLAAVEEATGGWGLGGRMFTAVYFGGNEWYSRFLYYLALMLVFLFVGAMMATIYMRWKTTGIVVTFVVLAILVAGAAAIVTLTDSWQPIATFVTSLSDLGNIAALVITALLAACVGYLVLRRATPRT